VARAAGEVPDRHAVEGKVRNLTSFGAFVEIEPGIDGLIHISDMSWTKRVQHPSEVLRKGDDVSVLVLGVDPENKRISLGLKQTQDDPWDELASAVRRGRREGRQGRAAAGGRRGRRSRRRRRGLHPAQPAGHPGEPEVANYVREGMALDVRVIEFDGRTAASC
jgi:small subunit ribosomal protein S1